MEYMAKLLLPHRSVRRLASERLCTMRSARKPGCLSLLSTIEALDGMHRVAPRRVGSTPPSRCLPDSPLKIDSGLCTAPAAATVSAAQASSHILRAISTPTSLDFVNAKLSHRKANLCAQTAAKAVAKG